jgi:hypothetical protein
LTKQKNVGESISGGNDGICKGLGTGM